ncbi:MAG: aminoacyl-tRNA hydrolase [Treponema sp.]|jgi:PTH1 family peptidyl-tRNA hydrolase|nr:aminoacyl-tRNA hydrolase [Treponema sp.]
MIQLIAFLGNPGLEYARNRHNAAWLLAQALPFYDSLSWRKKFKGLYVLYQEIHFLKPETFMNLSGESVFTAASFFKIDIKDILIIHDELELPAGTLSLKFSGGLGGHNGLRSMRKCFGNADFWRLRIGIGRPVTPVKHEKESEGSGTAGQFSDNDDNEDSGMSVYDWVLSDFSHEETEKLNPVLDAGAGLVNQLLIAEPDTLLKEWAKKRIN